MPHATWIPEAHCAIAQTLAVLGDAWDLLIIRDLARGHQRFDQLAAELAISRKVLTQRLRKLEAHGLIERRPYQQAPVRHEYRLSPRGLALVPVLVGLQDWGDQWLLGNGAPTGLGSDAAAHRLRGLVGTRLPQLQLPSTTGGSMDPVAPAGRTILFGYPLGSGAPKPAGWEQVPGAIGCMLENRLFSARYEEIKQLGGDLRGLSTQRPEEQLAFSNLEGVPFPLLSDAQLRLTVALRLPTFSVGGLPRIRRMILVLDRERAIVDALFPVTDIAAAVQWAVDQVASPGRSSPRSARRRAPVGPAGV